MIQVRWPAVLLALVVAAGCSGGGGAAPTSTTVAPPATLAVDPGTGTLTLGGSTSPLAVSSCQLDPTIDPATGVTTVFVLEAASADPATPFDVAVTRQSTGGQATTTTDTIAYAPATGQALEASRAVVNGAYIDLRHPGVGVAMLDILEDGVTAEATFGPPGSVAGDPGVLEGTLTARCP